MHLACCKVHSSDWWCVSTGCLEFLHDSPKGAHCALQHAPAEDHTLCLHNGNHPLPANPSHVLLPSSFHCGESDRGQQDGTQPQWGRPPEACQHIQHPRKVSFLQKTISCPDHHSHKQEDEIRLISLPDKALQKLT